ncbi:MAG: hypothetical protein ACYCUF_04150 [Acidimicrobiales bacterium]
MTTAWPGASICHARLRRDAHARLRRDAHARLRRDAHARLRRDAHARLRRDASELRLTTLRSTSHEAIRPEENATAMQALAGEQVSW